MNPAPTLQLIFGLYRGVNPTRPPVEGCEHNTTQHNSYEQLLHSEVTGLRIRTNAFLVKPTHFPLGTTGLFVPNVSNRKVGDLADVYKPSAISHDPDSVAWANAADPQFRWDGTIYNPSKMDRVVCSPGVTLALPDPPLECPMCREQARRRSSRLRRKRGLERKHIRGAGVGCVTLISLAPKYLGRFLAVLPKSSFY